MCGSGLRIGSLAGLKLQNLQRVPNYGIYQITVYQNTKEEYFTFCTPECASAIDSYLEFRKRNGDRLRPSEPLLRDEFDFNDQIQGCKPQNLVNIRSAWSYLQIISIEWSKGKITPVRKSARWGKRIRYKAAV